MTDKPVRLRQMAQRTPTVEMTLGEAAQLDLDEVLVVGIKDGEAFQLNSDMSTANIVHLLEVVKISHITAQYRLADDEVSA